MENCSKIQDMPLQFTDLSQVPRVSTGLWGTNLLLNLEVYFLLSFSVPMNLKAFTVFFLAPSIHKSQKRGIYIVRYLGVV